MMMVWTFPLIRGRVFEIEMSAKNINLFLIKKGTIQFGAQLNMHEGNGRPGIGFETKKIN